MTIRSMTGYGEGKAVSAGVSFTTQISSVNKKQLDVIVALPKYISYLEADTHKQIRKVLSRGRVNVSISIKSSKKSLSKVTIDQSLAASYLTAARNLAKEQKLKDDIRIEEIIKFDDVIKILPDLPDNKVLSMLHQRSLSRALASLKRMRSEEGIELANDICLRLDKLEKTIILINKRAPIVILNYKKRLLSKLKNHGFNKLALDERVISEVALFGDRCDITEEVTRIHSHLKQIRRLISSSKTVGRTLDFLCQELFREINTIGAKASDINITKETLSFKTELERVREQVQNVE